MAAIALIGRPAAFTGVGTTVSNGVTAVLNTAFSKLPAPASSNCLPVQAGDPQSATGDFAYTSGNALVDIDIGRPDKVNIVFDRKIRLRGKNPTPGTFRTQVITSGVCPYLYLYYKKTQVKQYLKEGTSAQNGNHAQPAARLRHRQRAD